MAKILVADDNSNIQKMVGLALKDQGIDVVAVGNGEAAVRKISDVRPDLVLADVFMPVRNGYEVCKYVKEDSALSHIPVILLVGAFDPLDEQEAQRVGADGVLKKPFVPPDPLISMVKSALTRAGVAHPSGGHFAQESAPPPLRAADLLTPQPQASAFPSPAPMPLTEPEPFREPVSKKPEPFTIESSAQPLAFGSLLETAGAQEAVDDTAYVTPPSSPMVPERNWGADEAVEEAQEEEASSGGWRPLAGGDEIDDIPAGRKDWREQAFAALEGIKRDAEKWAPTKEKTEIADEPAEIPAAAVAPEPVSSSPVVEGAPPAPPWMSRTGIPAPQVEAPASEYANSSFVTEVETEAPPAASPYSATPLPMEPLHQAHAQEAVEEEEAAAPPTRSEPPAEPASRASSQEWYSVPSNPWDAEAQKASQLASTWDAPAETANPAAGSDVEDAGVAAEAVSGYAASADPGLDTELPTETEEIIREEAVHAVEETVYEIPAPQASPHSSESPSEASSANVEEIVARVLAKMSPEVLHAVTREILKPVVEAIVRDELDKK